MKNILINCLMLLVAAALSLALVEFVGQKFLFKDMLYFVNDVDHRMRPNSRDDINSDGIRSRLEASEFPASEQNIVFLGDSFVYGFEVEEQQTVPALLQAKMRAQHPQAKVNVANFGWISSSPLLSLRLLKDIGHKYNPDVVMLAVDMTDFNDDIKYQKLLERKGIYSVVDYVPVTFMGVRKMISKVPALYNRIFGEPATRFFMTKAPLEETRPYFAYLQSNLDALEDYVVNQLDAKFVVFVFPRGYQYSAAESPNNWEQAEYEILGPYAHEPFRYFEEIAPTVDYPIFSLLSDFQETEVFPTALDNDPHWTQAGNRVAADAVYRYCLDVPCLVPSE